MSLVRPLLLTALVAGTAMPAAAQPSADERRVRILVLRPAEGAPPEGFDELVGTLRVMVGATVAIEVVEASIPMESAEQPAERWGGAVARSEGAGGVVWLQPGVAPGRSVLWVIRVDAAAEVAERFELFEPRTFDRMRTLALGARPLLEPLMDRARSSAPTATEPSEPPPGEPTDRALTDGASDRPAGRPEGRAPERAALEPRLALGVTVRNEGVLGARLVAELAFLARGWAHLSGELLRAETRGAGGGRQRAQTLAFAGVELAHGRIRARLGAGIGLALAWPERQERATGLILAAVGALTIELAPELFLSIPLTLEGVVARPPGPAIPGWQGSVGLLVGIAP